MVLTFEKLRAGERKREREREREREGEGGRERERERECVCHIERELRMITNLGNEKLLNM